MPGKILIVDDSPSDLLITGSILENLDHLVVKSQDGFSAIEKMSEEKFDLIIVDLQMPQMSGIELIKRIRRVPKHGSIPILVASARSEVSDVKLAIQVGANDYIVKPMDPMICEEKVTRLLGSQSSWEEYEIINPELSVLGLIQTNFKILSMSEVSITIETMHALRQGDILNRRPN